MPEAQILGDGNIAIKNGKVMLADPGDLCCGCPQYLRIPPTFLSIDSTCVAALSPPACSSTDYPSNMWCVTKNSDCTYIDTPVCLDTGSGKVEASVQVVWSGAGYWQILIKFNGTTNSIFNGPSTPCNPLGAYSDAGVLGACVTGSTGANAVFCPCVPLLVNMDITGITGSWGTCSPTPCVGGEQPSPVTMQWSNNCQYLQLDQTLVYCVGGNRFNFTLSNLSGVWGIGAVGEFSSGGAAFVFSGPPSSGSPVGTYTFYSATCGTLGGSIVIS